MPDPNIETFRIALFGSPGVGKSTIISQLAIGVFDDYDYDPTYENVLKRETMVHNKPCVLEFWDMDDKQGRLEEVRECDGTMLVYSVNSRQSFARVEQIWMELKRIKMQVGLWDPFQVCIVGNRIDVRHRRMVSAEEGRTLAKKLGCGFEECSAMTCANVEKAPYDLVRKIMTYRDNERIRYLALQEETKKQQERKAERRLRWKKVFRLSEATRAFR